MKNLKRINMLKILYITISIKNNLNKLKKA